MSIKLSIIVPVFNDEKHIDRCLKSVLEQDIGANDYEVIVVNDGSYDGTQAIVEEMQDQHQNLFLVNTENKKLGAARNTGLKYSKGKYILFVDSDDYIKKDVLAKLLYEISFNDLDVLMADFYNLENSSAKLLNNTSYSNNNLRIQSGIEFIKSNEIYWFAWHCIYKKTFFIQNNIKYREGVFFEDVDVSIKSVFFAKAIKYEPIFFYIHTFNRNSIVNSRTTSKKLQDQVAAAIYLQEFVKETKAVDGRVHSILMQHVILKFIRPLKTSAYLSYVDRLDTCRAIKKSSIILDIYFKKNRLFFILIFMINLSPIFCAIAITALSPLVKLLKFLRNMMSSSQNKIWNSSAGI